MAGSLGWVCSWEFGLGLYGQPVVHSRLDVGKTTLKLYKHVVIQLGWQPHPSQAVHNKQATFKTGRLVSLAWRQKALRSVYWCLLFAVINAV